MHNFDALARAYQRQVQLPWRSDVPSAARVWMLWYDKSLELRVQGQLPQFEAETRRAGHGWIGFDMGALFGASPPKGGTSPVAVFHAGRVRKLTPAECLRLQGFDPGEFEGLIEGTVFRMAGNAVPRPLGAFAAETAYAETIDLQSTVVPTSEVRADGVLLDGDLYAVRNPRGEMASNLSDFLHREENGSLSNQAAAGLLVRIIKSNRPIPIELFETLYELSLTRTSLRGTKKNSFDILHKTLDPMAYRRSLGLRLAA